jgi:hypothetical protein
MAFAGFDNTYPEIFGISIDILFSWTFQTFHVKDAGLNMTFFKLFPSYHENRSLRRLTSYILMNNFFLYIQYNTHHSTARITNPLTSV